MITGELSAGGTCLHSSRMATSSPQLLLASTLRALGLRRTRSSSLVLPNANCWATQLSRVAAWQHRAHATAELQEVATSSGSSTANRPKQSKQATGHSSKQTLDYTALVACCQELSGAWVPSKVEEVSCDTG